MDDIARIKINRSTKLIQYLSLHATIHFEELRKQETLIGDWYSNEWGTWRRKYWVNCVTDKNANDRTTAASEDSPKFIIPRLLVLNYIDEKKSDGVIRSRIRSIKALCEELSDDISDWTAISAVKLSSISSSMISKYPNKRALAIALGNLHQVINDIEELGGWEDGRFNRFTTKRCRWKPSIRQPNTGLLDGMSPDFDEHTQNKYIKDLGVGIVKAYHRISSDEYLENLYGIKIRVIIFCLSMGLRISEALRLEKDSLFYDDRAGSYFLRVLTEKGASPYARPVPDRWSAIIKDTFDFIIDRTNDLREKAQKIESCPQEYAKAILLESRMKKKVSLSARKALSLAGYDIDEYFFLSELSRVTGYSEEKLISSTHLSNKIIKIPGLTSQKIIYWMDEREKNDDLNHILQKLMIGKIHKNKKISCYRFSELTGTRKSTILSSKRLHGFYLEISDLITSHFEEEPQPDKKQFLSKWASIKSRIKKNEGGAAHTIIHIDAVSRLIEEEYRSIISRFYKRPINKLKIIDSCIIESPSYTYTLPPSRLLFLSTINNTSASSEWATPRPMFQTEMYDFLSRKAGKKTIFERLAIKNELGQEYSFSPHQIRHWVTTALLRSGPNETLIDMFLGRKPGTFIHYDHRTAKERAESIREKVYLDTPPPDDWLGRKIKKMKNEGISNDEIEDLVRRRIKTIHFSPWGYCSRDLIQNPCPKGTMCLTGFGGNNGCENFLLDIRNKENLIKITQLRDRYRTLLEALIPNSRNHKELSFELNDQHKMDKHALHVISVINGCEKAIKAYEQSDNDE